jgi:hypothetical protein
VPILAFACFVALLVLFAAYFTDRNGDMDELGMYNPSYMVARFGILTFPAYPWNAYFDDPVIVHPPVHLGVIGLLSRLGFTWYYGEATPTVLFLLLAIVSIVVGAFASPVKLGLLFSIGFLMLSGETFAIFFGTRPEGELHAAWFAGLLLLESGRLEQWNRTKLFAGAFVLTWASGLHYYAGAAFTGVLVYIVWAVWSLGWKDAKSRVVALCMGGSLFGIPYLGLFVLPHSKKILMAIQTVPSSGGVFGSVRAHLELYRQWSQIAHIPALVRKPCALGIPLMVFSTAVLSLVRSTRGIALAALPLQLSVFVFAFHKQPWYLVHEIGLFTASAGVGVLVLGDQLFRRVSIPGFQRVFLPIAAVLLFLYLVKGNPTLGAAVVTTEPRVHEGEVARAAARQILGPHARVAGRVGAWYSSGAEHWYDIERDMLQVWPYDPITYFSNFDAVADYAHMSDSTNNSTISSWYANGTLKLRGFYFGETNEQLQIVLLSPLPTHQVVGYAAKNGQLYRFEQFPDGDYAVLSAACRPTPELQDAGWQGRFPGTFSAMLHLPRLTPDAPAVLVTVLAPRRSAEPDGWIGRFCKETGRIYGTLLLADRKELINSLRRDDTPIHFYRTLEEMPAYVGVGLPKEMTPPKESVRLDNVIELSKIQAASRQARLDRTPQIHLTSAPGIGSFTAFIPLTHAESVTRPCSVQLRLKVLTGGIGFALYSGRSGILSRTKAFLLKSNEPMDAVLRVPSLRDADQILIFNGGESIAQVEVLDATILLTREDWERNKATLSIVR